MLSFYLERTTKMQLLKNYNIPLATRLSLKMTSVFLLFAILTNIIYLPCYFYVRNLNEEIVLERFQSKLESGIRTLDISIEALSSLYDSIMDNNEMRFINRADADINDIVLNKMRSTVSDHLLPYDFITEIGLTTNKEILFTRSRIYYDRELMQWHNYLSFDQADYLQQFNNAYCIIPATHFTSTTYGRYEAFTLAFRWSKLHNIYFFAHYPLRAVYALLCDSVQLDDVCLTMYFGDKLVAQSNEDFTESHEILSATGSNALRLKVELQLPHHYIEKNLASMQRLVHIFVVIVILALLFWIIIFALYLSTPFTKISKALYSSGLLSEESTNLNSTQTVIEGIKKLDIKLNNLNDIIRTQKERIQLHVLEQAIYRGLYNQEIRHAFQEAYPNFPSQWRLALLSFSSDTEAFDNEALQILIPQYLEQHLPGIIMLPTERDAMLMVLSLTEGRNPEKELATLCRIIEQDHNLLLGFTLSPVYNDPAMLPDAFQQIEYETFSHSPLQQQCHSNNIQLISLQHLQTIYLSLMNGDANPALIALRHSTNAIVNSQDFYLAKYTYRMIANILVKIRLETAYDLQGIPIPAFYNDSISKLFKEDLPRCFEQIAEKIRFQQIQEEQSLEQEIIAYIDQNSANHALCITMMTDHFGMSAPTLQKLLKQKTGKTFSAYVESLRMHKAQTLLRTSNMTVQNVAEAVGYTNANSFYKAYKRYFGETTKTVRNDK